MAFGGHLFIATGNQEPLKITEAIVTSDRIFVEWLALGEVGQLEATSTDGVLFRGEFHVPLDGPAGTCELTLFKSLREYLLFGQWQNPTLAQRGTWAFRLQTDVIRPNRASVSRPPAPTDPLEPPRKVHRPAAQVEMTKPSGESVAPRAPKPRPSPEHTPEVSTEAAAPVAVRVVESTPSATMFSSQLDHLMEMTSAEFAAGNLAELEAALATAPSSAVFKVSRSAAAPELRALAAAVIDRMRTILDSTPPRPQSEPIVDAKTLRAQQRRSSKHWKG